MDAFAAAAKDGMDVVLDYLWGAPTEALVEALTGHDFTRNPALRGLSRLEPSRARRFPLPAAALRSSGLEIYGSGGGSVGMKAILEAIPQILEHAARGDLKLETKQVPLPEVETAWTKKEDRRVVFIP